MQEYYNPMKPHKKRNIGEFYSHFSLIELVVVLLILVAVAGVVIGLVGDSVKQSRQDATRVNLELIRDVIVGSDQHTGYFHDQEADDPLHRYPRPLDSSPREEHPQLRYLFINPDLESVTVNFDPLTRLGWRGPYLQHSNGTYTVNNSRNFTNDYGEDGDPAIIDAWGNPIIIQEPSVGTAEQRELNTRLISAGPDGLIDTPRNQLEPSDLSESERDDDLILFLRVADTGE